MSRWPETCGIKSLPKPAYQKRAEAILSRVWTTVIESPANHATWVQLLADSKPAFMMLIVGERADKQLKTANARFLTLARSNPDTLSLFRDKHKPGKLNIYVCQDNACQLPVDAVDKAVARIAQLRVRPERIAL